MPNLPHQQAAQPIHAALQPQGHFNHFLQAVEKWELQNKQNTNNKNLSLLKELKTAGYHGSFFTKTKNLTDLKHKSKLRKADLLLQFRVKNEQETKQYQKKPTPAIPNRTTQRTHLCKI